ncbi:TPA: phage tail tape measure protein, partial [Citrobacter farmeri]|nr:phage tail tape measure protein [Citrobacter farmeri]
AGGQAGIAREDLKAFAEDALKMGVAFDQSADQSGDMMAKWRTSFKMTQGEVVALADKINYLSNNGAANAQQISDIVTRIGPLGAVAGIASGQIAALGATLAGVGVEQEVAATGIKNFMLAITGGSKQQQEAFQFLGFNSRKLAADMQKDAQGTMLKVLESISKLDKDRQPKALNALFGKESIGAIAPLLTNLDLLKKNFNMVGDASQYTGSMQKEYEARAATTAMQLQLLRNQATHAGIALGNALLPQINASA